MADIHVIDGNLNGEYRVVMHFAVASANNSVGVNWRDALKNSGLIGTFGEGPTSTSVSVLPDGDGTGGTISPAEKTQLANGEVVEHVETVLAESGGTSNAELKATLQSRYTKASIRVLVQLQKRLKYYGHNEASV